MFSSPMYKNAKDYSSNPKRSLIYSHEMLSASSGPEPWIMIFSRGLIKEQEQNKNVFYTTQVTGILEDMSWSTCLILKPVIHFYKQKVNTE